MLRKIVLSILFTSMFSMAYGQAAYMDEFYEDAVESGSDGAVCVRPSVVLRHDLHGRNLFLYQKLRGKSHSCKYCISGCSYVRPVALRRKRGP